MSFRKLAIEPRGTYALLEGTNPAPIMPGTKTYFQRRVETEIKHSTQTWQSAYARRVSFSQARTRTSCRVLSPRLQINFPSLDIRDYEEELFERWKRGPANVPS